MKFVGNMNYEFIFSDKNFYKSLAVTIRYMFVAVPCKLAFALFIAVILNMKLKGIGFFRTIYYMPSILGGSVAISILWRLLFERDGIINMLTGKIGIPPIDWLGSPRHALNTISILTVWQFGSSMILFLAGLKQIPMEIEEAAGVEGASKFRIFFKIKLPMLSPIIFFNLIMQMIYASQEFTAPYVITKGGPIKATYLYSMMIYENAFTFLKMGYASALSWIWFVLIGLFTLLLFKSSSTWTFYDDGRNFF
jgi:oligogalacturonide transport system permease protein